MIYIHKGNAHSFDSCVRESNDAHRFIPHIYKPRAIQRFMSSEILGLRLKAWLLLLLPCSEGRRNYSKRKGKKWIDKIFQFDEMCAGKKGGCRILIGTWREKDALWRRPANVDDYQNV